MFRVLLRVKRHLSSISYRYASTSTPTTATHQQEKRDRGIGYVILVPEVPFNTPETNPPLNTGEMPNFEETTTVAWRNALIKLSLELESSVWKTEQDLKTKDLLASPTPELALRWNNWQVHASRASGMVGDKLISISIIIEEIRANSSRGNMARLFGYESYADLRTVTKMAGILENVKTKIASLFVGANPKQSEEISSLQTFAESRGSDHKLKLWDMPYLRRKQPKCMYNLDHTIAKPYFPIPMVPVDLELDLDGWGIEDDSYRNRLAGNSDDPYYCAGEKLGVSFWKKEKFGRLDLANLGRVSVNLDFPGMQFIQRRGMASLLQMHRTGPHMKVRPEKRPLGGNPMMKGVVLKTLIKKPKKPNSANRKCVLVRLSSGKEAIVYVPGVGHNLQEHNIVLVRVGRLQDVPGVKLKCVRGVYDLPHVVKQKQT